MSAVPTRPESGGCRLIISSITLFFHLPPPADRSLFHSADGPLFPLFFSQKILVKKFSF